MQDWRARVTAMHAVPGTYRHVNEQIVRDTIGGVGPHSGRRKAEAGARVVYNLSALHVPALLTAGAKSQRPYKNGYDLQRRIGDAAKPSPLRTAIDAIVAQLVPGAPAHEDLYYGAVEVNGSGMRYYGDICLVLKPAEIADDTLVLFRNSYDLSCSPIVDELARSSGPQRAAAALAKARELAGGWERDLPDMAVCKILHAASPVERRLTTGAVSDGVLCDEDYLEVVRAESFGVAEIDEARVSAADAAADGRIADRLLRGPTPSLAELQWRQRRRRADRALAAHGLRTRIVVTTGRART